MGRDKATLPFGETTLAERAAAIVQAAFPNARVTFVAANAGQFPGLNVICDTRPGRGPLGGLHAALKNAESEWIFLLGCDLPDTDWMPAANDTQDRGAPALMALRAPSVLHA